MARGLRPQDRLELRNSALHRRDGVHRGKCDVVLCVLTPSAAVVVAAAAPTDALARQVVEALATAMAETRAAGPCMRRRRKFRGWCREQEREISHD